MTKLIQITAYVRNDEDLARWKAIANKTEWLHDKLIFTRDPMLGEPAITYRGETFSGKDNVSAIERLSVLDAEPTITPPEQTA